MTTTKTSSALLGAMLVACVCLASCQGQKSSANSFQQTISSGGPNSVYGGYGQSSAPAQQQQQWRQPSSLVSPVGQRRNQQTYSGRKQQSEQVAQRPQPVYTQQESSSSSSSSSYDQQAEADAEPASYGSVNGQPGQDFPAYTRVPKTSFSCDGLPYDYGMYADEETGCQAYHVCYNGRKDSFLCGVGTVFNQRILHCDYWYSVDCGKSSQYYGSNAYMGSSQPEPGPAQAGVNPEAAAPQPQQQQQSSYRRNEVSSPSYNRPVNAAPPPRQQQQVASNSFARNTQQVQESY